MSRRKLAKAEWRVTFACPEPVEWAVIDGVYCLTCFISYLALSFGLFRFLKLFSGYKLIQLGVNCTMAAILIILALLNCLTGAETILSLQRY